jgi:hypothetical protein
VRALICDQTPFNPLPVSLVIAVPPSPGAQVVFFRKRQVGVQYLHTTITDAQRAEFGRLVEDTIRRIESAEFPSPQWDPFPAEPVQELSLCGTLFGKARDC